MMTKKRTAERKKWIGTEGEGRGDMIALKRLCSCYEGIKRRINSREARIGIRMTKKGLGRGKKVDVWARSPREGWELIFRGPGSTYV
jgi:hypothetical protein